MNLIYMQIYAKERSRNYGTKKYGELRREGNIKKNVVSKLVYRIIYIEFKKKIYYDLIIQ